MAASTASHGLRLHHVTIKVGVGRQGGALVLKMLLLLLFSLVAGDFLAESGNLTGDLPADGRRVRIGGSLPVS